MFAINQQRKYNYKCNNESEKEYSSSSEQSCDTVIYIGSNGKRIPYNELTDCTDHLQANKKIKIKFNANTNKLNEIWIDGPKQQQLEEIKNKNNEIWIDGPNAQNKQFCKLGAVEDIEEVNKEDNEVAHKADDLNSNHNSSDKFIASFFGAIRETVEKQADLDSIDNNNKTLSLKCDSSESLQCLDRVLLQQLNQQALEILDSDFPVKLDPNSRPISLLSVNSDNKQNFDMSSIATNASNSEKICENTESQNSSKHSSCVDLASLNNENENVKNTVTDISEEVLETDISLVKPTSINIGYNTLPNIRTISESNNPLGATGTLQNDDVMFKQKLEDLKTSYDQMIFKQSYRDMESLHKTLESMLGIPPNLLKNQENTSIMSEEEKDKRLSRILSPTRLPRNYFGLSSSNNTYKLSTGELTKPTNVFQAPNIINPINQSSAFPQPALQPTVSIESPTSNMNDQYSEPFDNLLTQCHYANNKTISNEKSSNFTNLMIVNNKRMDSYTSVFRLNKKENNNLHKNLVSLPSTPSHFKPGLTNMMNAPSTASYMHHIRLNSESVPTTPINARKNLNENASPQHQSKLIKNTLNKENKQPQTNNKFVNLFENLNRKSNKNKSGNSLSIYVNPEENFKQQSSLKSQQPKESILQRLFRSKSKDKSNNKKLNNKITPIINDSQSFNQSILSSPNMSLISRNHTNHSTPIQRGTNMIFETSSSIITSSKNQNKTNVTNNQHRSSVSDNSSVLSCDLSVSNNLIEYGVHSLIPNSSASSGGAASTSSGYESMNRDSNDSDNTSTSSKSKPSKPKICLIIEF